MKFGARGKSAVVLAVAGAAVVMGFQNCTASDDWKKQLAGSSLSSSSVSLPPAPLPTPVPTPSGPTTTELLGDPLMQTGFQEQDPCPSTTTASCGTTPTRNVPNGLYPAFAGQAPKWTLQQWGSRAALYGGGGFPYGNGLVWSINEKHIAVFPGGIFEMGVNGYEDWLGQYRQTQPARLAWPSFTLGYSLGNLGNPAATPGGNVAGMQGVRMAIDARLANENSHQQAGYDPTQNTVIFNYFISVQNLQAGSAGYGQFVFMNMPIYNDLERMPGPHINGDTYGPGLGTGMLIYSPAYTTYSQTSLWDLGWVHLEADVLNHVKNSVTVGLQKGLLKDPDLSHYYLTGINIGFEVTGLNETTIQFKNISLKVTR